MAAVLLVLKIIGIILLCLLAFVILIVGVLMFVPVCYQGRIQYTDKLEADGKVTFLLRIFQIQFQKNVSGFRVWLRIFGFKKMMSEEKKEDTEEAFVQQKETFETEKGQSLEPEKNFEEEERTQEQHYSQEKKEDEAKDRSEEKSNLKKKKKRKAKKEKKEEDEFGENFDQELDEKLAELEKEEKRETKPNFQSKIQDGKEKISDIKGIINDEANREMVRKILREIKYLIHHYGPRRLKGHISYSTGNPAWTGMATGLVSLVPLVYQKECSILPDFQSDVPYAEGELYAKGHIRLIHAIVAFIRTYRNPNVRKWIKQLR
ncbi:MAG: DUF2953 domain-containing protein [Lachnospiraceae bacterium]